MRISDWSSDVCSSDLSHPISKPIIAAVNGFAFGGGCEIALMSDIIVAADHAQFGLPEVKVGLFAAAGGAFRLAQQMPKKLAMEHMLTGDPIPAARAAAFRLVHHVVPPAHLIVRSRSGQEKRESLRLK